MREIIKLAMRYLLKYLDEEMEGRVILRSVLTFKYLKHSITKIVFDYERPKPIPRSNTIPLTNVTSVTLKDLNPFLDLTPYH